MNKEQERAPETQSPAEEHWLDPASQQQWAALRERVRAGREALRARFVAWRERERVRRDTPLIPGRIGMLPTWAWMTLAVGFGLAVRLYFHHIKAGMHFPDEMYQYLEPAYWKKYGDGWLPWEYRRGVRNWILPGYYGGLIEIGEALGYERWALHRFLTLHSACLSVVIVPMAFRLGFAVGRGDGRLAVLSAFAVALFPYLGYFAPHTLSGLHGMIFITWAMALWMEQVAFPDHVSRVRRSFLIGVLFGLAVVSRYTLLMFIPLVALDYNFRSRFAELLSAAAGLLFVMAILGWIDLLTWGRPLHSFAEFFNYNLLADGSSQHGTSRTSFYWELSLGSRLGGGRWLLLLPMTLFFHRHWRLMIGWLVPLLLLTAVKHKEERFLMQMWPLFLVAAMSGWLAVVGALGHIRRLKAWSHWPRAQVGGLALALMLVVVLNARGLPPDEMRLHADTFEAQSWIGSQPDASGMLQDERVMSGGGYLLMHRSIPQLEFWEPLVDHTLFNYVAVLRPERIALMEGREDFEAVAHFGEVVVFKRRAAKGQK